MSSSFISSIDEALYASQFCEENIYQLSVKFLNWNNDLINNNVKYDIYNGYVVFISNDEEAIPLWKQRSSKSDKEPVMWDYHVIFIVEKEKRALSSLNDIKSFFSNITLPPKEADMNNKSTIFEKYVYDLDSTLSFPIESSIYCKEAIRSFESFPIKFKQKFRIIPADDYIKYFSSDRSHMKLSKVPFPTWKCIQGIDSLTKMNLSEYRSMKISTKIDSSKDIKVPIKNYFGQVMSCSEFTEWCSNTTVKNNFNSF